MKHLIPSSNSLGLNNILYFLLKEDIFMFNSSTGGYSLSDIAAASGAEGFGGGNSGAW
jgi:hypothetical protein